MRAEIKKRIIRIIAVLTLVAMAAGSFAVYAFADDTVSKQGSEPADIEIQGGASQEGEADLSEYADAVLSDYDAKASAEEVDMNKLPENSKVNGEDPEEVGGLKEDEEGLSEEEAEALKKENEKFEKALSDVKLSGKKDKDFANIVNSQVGRKAAWEVGFVNKLMEAAGIVDIKTKAKTIEKWIEEISKAEAASLETIKSNAEKAAKGVESEAVKLVSYTPYEEKEMKASDLVFFAQNEKGEIVYKVGVYSEKNFSKGSKGSASPIKGKAVMVTGDSQGNVVEETFTIVKGIDKDYNELSVKPLEKKVELEKAGEDLSKMVFIAEKEIVIDGVVSIEAEKVAIKAAPDKIIMKETADGSIVTVRLTAASFGEPVDNYSIEAREIPKNGEDYGYCLSRAKDEVEKDASVEEVVDGRFVEVLVFNGAGERVNPASPLDVEIVYNEGLGLAAGQIVKATSVGEKTAVEAVLINQAPLTEELKAKEKALMEELGEDEEEEEPKEAKDAIKSLSFKTANLSAMGIVVCNEKVEKQEQPKAEKPAQSQKPQAGQTEKHQAQRIHKGSVKLENAAE